jgi:HTH-type transcriptional regulator, sugar sensing transcriptional regulator
LLIGGLPQGGNRNLFQMSPMSIINSTLLETLADLGMSEREAKVYLALLSKRCAPAASLQKLSGVPQSKIYEIIGSLVQQGFFLERKVGTKRTFEIIDPQITLAASFQKLQLRLKNSFKHRKELEKIYGLGEAATEPLEYIEVLRGNENIHHRYCALVNSTSEELLGFGRGPYACDTNDKSAAQNQEERGILHRGGIVRWVYELQLPQDTWLLEDMINLTDGGAGVRIARRLPIKMMIFDRNTLLVADEEPFAEPGELTMSIIKQKTIVNAFCALFEYFWAMATELDEWQSLELHEGQGNNGNHEILTLSNK